jgi:putative membrane protein
MQNQPSRGMRFMSTLVANILALLLGAWILPGIHVEGNDWSIILIAFVIALLNAFVRPLLILLTIPATILTLGLFILVINAAVIMLAGHLLDDFKVAGFWSAFFFALILSLVTSIIGKLDRGPQRRQ